LVFGGLPEQMLDLVQSAGALLYISESIINEVSGTLLRKFGWTAGNLKEFLPPLWERCNLVDPTTRLKVCSDPDDNHVLECAVAAHANYLVTGNIKHFPAAYEGVRAVTARWIIEHLITRTDD
jgi:putative PIN family toxin of toxin-antitoxin system